jgi:hypothetical protein
VTQAVKSSPKRKIIVSISREKEKGSNVPLVAVQKSNLPKDQQWETKLMRYLICVVHILIIYRSAEC